MDGHRHNSPPITPVTVNDIREAIGNLVILWSRIEAELHKSLHDLDPQAEPLCASKAILRWRSLYLAAAPGPKAASIGRRFINRIETARLFRNSIFHGFEGYEADPFGHGSPVLVHHRVNGKAITTSFADFQRILADLANASFMLYRLTDVIRDPHGTYVANLLDAVESDLDRVAAEHPETT